jgi:hypothetical protein
VGDVMPCDREIQRLVKHLILLSILKNYLTSDCASSDMSVRLESKSLARPHSLDACVVLVTGRKC